MRFTTTHIFFIFLVIGILTELYLVTSKKPFNTRLQATWRLECELGILNDEDCPIDGGWSPWASWSICQGACDSVGHRKRLRECNNPSPSKDGMTCSGLDEQIESCYLTNCTTNDYRKLVEGDISRAQTLKELEAMPAFMDRCLQMECPFEAVEAALMTENTWQLSSESLWNALQCVKHDIGCPVSGEWGAWGTWSSCGARCGKGQRWRSRQCNTPPPSAAHLVCIGSPLQLDECEGDQCAIDGEYTENSTTGSWSAWGEWTKCSEKCAPGIRRRKRTCIEKYTSSFAVTWGTHCRGQYDELQICSNTKCMLNGGWSGWRAWGPCSQSCGAGRRSRTRSCTRPIPSGNGIHCLGPKLEVGACHLKPCEVYTHMIGVFSGDSVLQYHFQRKRSTFFHFYIRFMPLFPHGTLIRRGKTQNPQLRLSLHKWHVCLDVSGVEKSCLPRMCSPNSLEPATWHALVLTVTNEAASLRLNDAQVSTHGSFSCDPEFTNDIMNIYLGERLHGEVQEVIVNFTPLDIIIDRERRADRTDFIPSSASNVAYEKANMEEAYLNIQIDQYLRLPCFQVQDEWQIELTIKSKRDGGTVLFLPSGNTNSWFYLAMTNMRVKIKFAHGGFKSEATSSTEYLPHQWLDIGIIKKRNANTIEVSLNAGERLHLLLMEDVNKERQKNSHFNSFCSNLNIKQTAKQTIEKLQCKAYYANQTKLKEMCSNEYYVGGIPTKLQNSIFEDFIPFSGVIASLKVNYELLDLHGYTIERDKDGVVQVSSRTASISGSYHETGWGESNALNLYCLYARTTRSPHAAYWLYFDTGLKLNNNVKFVDDGRVLRLILTADDDFKGFYTCRARGIKRTINYVTYGILGKLHYKLTSPDSITAVAVCTTITLVIFTLAWLVLEGYHDILDGYGFYRDAHLSPEEEAEIVCKYIDQNVHLLGSQSAVNLAKANTRLRGRRLASRANLGVQEAEGMSKIDDTRTISDCEPKDLPLLPESKTLVTEPSHEVYKCEPSYVSSPRHGSNITSHRTGLTSSVETSPRHLCSRLLVTKFKVSSKESILKKNTNCGVFLQTRDKSILLTTQSSPIVNKSPVEKVLQKFHELK